MAVPFVVRGAVIVDGSGRPPETGDVRVGPDGLITAIATTIAPGAQDVVVDGDGLVLAPGFVDMHSHSDLYTLVRPDEGGSEGGSEDADASTGAPVGDGPKLLQGCTAQVFGQDGISAAPVHDHDVADYAGYIAGLDGFLEPARWTWRSFGAYLAELRRRSSTRVAGLVGHSTVRRFAMGMHARPPTADELDAMCGAVDEAMRAGAIGLSTGLVYVPAAYAATGELVALCRVVARHGGRFFVHVRSESDRVVEATEEIIDVARRSGVHLHYSHIKTAGRANWHKAARLLELLDGARREGVSVTADVHPYTAGSSTGAVLLPPWLLEGGIDAALVRLRDPAARARARDQMLADTTTWDNWYAFSDGWGGLRVAGARRRPDAVGRSFADVIHAAGVTDMTSPEAFAVVFDLLAEEALALSLISFNNVEANVARFMAQPYCTIGSDALVNPGGQPHPRLYGTFPRVLGRFVRELGTLTLPEAVRAMTVRAAQAIGRDDLGPLAPGRVADLVLFDPAVVADRATYEDPRLPPIGIERVWVGGQPVAAHGALAATVSAADTTR